MLAILASVPFSVGHVAELHEKAAKEGLPRECKVAKKFAHHPLVGARRREGLALTGQNSKQLATNWIPPALDRRASIESAAIKIWLSFVKDFMGLRHHATPKTPASPCILAPPSTPVFQHPPNHDLSLIHI